MAECAKIDLDAALEDGRIQRGEASEFWRCRERDGHIVYFNVTAWDGDCYLLELSCDRFWDEPIRGRFADPDTKQCLSSAWPRGDQTFAGWFKWDPSNLFICWPADRGGIEHHTDWRILKYWQKDPNPLHQYLEFIRKCLNLRSLGYQPRK